MKSLPVLAYLEAHKETLHAVHTSAAVSCRKIHRLLRKDSVSL